MGKHGTPITAYTSRIGIMSFFRRGLSSLPVQAILVAGLYGQAASQTSTSTSTPQAPAAAPAKPALKNRLQKVLGSVTAQAQPVAAIEAKPEPAAAAGKRKRLGLPRRLKRT